MEEMLNKIDDLIEYLEENKSNVEEIDIEETESLLNELHNFKESLEGVA